MSVSDIKLGKLKIKSMKRNLLAISNLLFRPTTLFLFSILVLSVLFGMMELKVIETSEINIYQLIILLLILCLGVASRYKFEIPDRHNENVTAFVKKEKVEKEVIILKKVEELIQGRLFDAHLSVSDIEKEIGVSRPVLLNIFKNTKGTTVVDYIKKERIRKAKELLETTTLNISEIAYKIGYSDPKYFSKSFRKSNKMTPTQYRKFHNKLNTIGQVLNS
uniref:Response regulator receiver protein n=2 Tax=Flammeovirga TaxID=59739 RepID=D0PR31_9BACT|nr:response regulator receiver protein [Flammeovirga yaeyamensis]